VVGKTSGRQAYHSSRGCMLGREHRETKRRRKGVVTSVGNNRVVVGRAGSNQTAVGQVDSSRMAAAGSSQTDIHIPALGPDCPGRKAQAEKVTKAEAGDAFGPPENLTAL
jgi:hypothetical protein